VSAAGRFLKNQLSKADFAGKAANRTRGNIGPLKSIKRCSRSRRRPSADLSNVFYINYERAGADRLARRERNLRPRRSCFTRGKKRVPFLTLAGSLSLSLIPALLFLRARDLSDSFGD